MTESASVRPIVVVGVDGSPQSGEALRWAARYSALRDATLRVVIAWEHAPGFGYFPEGVAGFTKEAHRTLEHTIDKFLGAEQPVGLEKKVVQGAPKSVLVEESSTAELLVVGDRGYGGFAGLLLGSVGEACVHHARCSVVVVRMPSHDGAG